MALALSNLRAIVTGSGSGLGRTIALRFAAEGAVLALCDRDEAGMAETAALIRAEGGTAHPFLLDLLDVPAIGPFIDEAAARMGGIDVVCNNAAIAARNAIEDEDEAGWDMTQAINLKAGFFVVKHALPHLRRSAHKSVVNVSSMAGSFGIAGLSAYCASKGGVIALTRALAVELAPNEIRVNCVSPGSMMTPAMAASIARIDSLGKESGKEAIARLTNRQLFRRVADPSEVASIVTFLASSEASYLTGENINASGGWAAH